MIEMVEAKTASLEFGALDWCISQIEGLRVELTAPNYGNGTALVYISGTDPLYRPSTDWSFGGPLIEKHRVCLDTFCGKWDGLCDEWIKGCDTPLIAVCRSIVAAKMGDIVKVPRELIP